MCKQTTTKGLVDVILYAIAQPNREEAMDLIKPRIEVLRKHLGTGPLLQLIIPGSDYEAMLDPNVLQVLCGPLTETDGDLLVDAVECTGNIGAMNLFSSKGTETYLRVVQASPCTRAAINAYLNFATYYLKSLRAGLDWSVLLDLVSQHGMQTYHGVAIGQFLFAFLRMCCHPAPHMRYPRDLRRLPWMEETYRYNTGKEMRVTSDMVKGMDLEEVALRKEAAHGLPWKLRFRCLAQGGSEREGYFRCGTVYLERMESGQTKCAICQDEMYGAAYRVGCRHLFHFACYCTWLHTKLACPLCESQPVVK